MKHLSKLAGPFVALLACAGVVGCGPSQGQGPPPGGPAMPEVDVDLPVTKQVTDFEEFPGRIEAVSTIEIRARATGYLEKVHFKEGADVKKDELLFEIDPRQYKAELARAEGTVVQMEGRLARLKADLTRAESLLPRNAIGREDYDKTAGDVTEAKGSTDVAKANRDLADLNLSYTQVKAPISGRISRRMIDPGNLVKADETMLAVIVSLNPIHATFDLDERTTLRLKKLIREKKIKWSMDEGLPVKLGLADEDGFPREGVINFADNRVDPDTGTWRLRARFDNRDLALTPGLFVRVRLPIGSAHEATLVSEKALSTDQGQRFVYVVNQAGKVEYRRVQVGRVHDGQRVITDGVKPGEQVIVSGLQHVRPDMEVKTRVQDKTDTNKAAEESRPSGTSAK